MTTLPRRFDLYVFIHKGLRALMTDTLVATGRMDTEDGENVAAVLLQLDTLLEVCTTHLRHEDEFVHAAMERRAPGSAAHCAAEHAEHESTIAYLRQLMHQLEQSHGGLRAEAALRLYHALACFVADNLLHMQVEEHHNNEILWRHFSDAELQAIHQGILADIDPELVRYMLGWMLRSLNADERLQLLGGMQRDMPAAAFAGVLAGFGSLVSAGDRRRLQELAQAEAAL